MKKHIIYPLLLLALISCTKTIDFNEEGFADQMVLNSIFWPDSVFKASLTKSASILENGLEPGESVTDASLDIYENDEFLTHLTSSTGRFRAEGIKPKAGNTYKAVVTSMGNQVTAETTVPLGAEIVSIDTSSVKVNYGNIITTYKIKIKDPEGEDFYRIVVDWNRLYGSLYQNKIWKYYLTKEIINFSTSDPVFKSVYNNFGDEIVEIGPDNRYRIFPDNLFQGKEYTLQIQLRTYDDSQLYGFKPYYEIFTFHVQRISKDLYNYLKYLELYEFYHDNPIAEPVPVYSNVRNGAGIFAGFNDDAKISVRTDYLPYSMDTIKLEKNPSYGGYGGYGGYGY